LAGAGGAVKANEVAAKRVTAKATKRDRYLLMFFLEEFENYQSELAPPPPDEPPPNPSPEEELLEPPLREDELLPLPKTAKRSSKKNPKIPRNPMITKRIMATTTIPTIARKLIISESQVQGLPVRLP
jgi:hypothetical protein